MPTSASSSTTRSRASCLDRPRLVRSASEICVAHREHRVERAHRLLEHHGDAPAAQGAHLGVAQLSARRGPRRRMRPRGISPGGSGISRMIERAVTDLPDPDSPTSPKVSPRCDGEGHAIDGRQFAPPQAKAHGEIVEFQNRLGHIASRSSRAFASRVYDGHPPCRREGYGGGAASATATAGASQRVPMRCVAIWRSSDNREQGHGPPIPPSTQDHRPRDA